MHTSAFIRNVLNNYRDHNSSFWSPEDVDLIESERAELREQYSDDLRYAVARCNTLKPLTMLRTMSEVVIISWNSVVDSQRRSRTLRLSSRIFRFLSTTIEPL